MRLILPAAGILAALVLSGCGLWSNSGGYYQNDGPPSDWNTSSSTKGAEPRVESFYPASLRPYTVMGKRYTPVTSDIAMKQQGTASWYGKQFHGNKTSIGETYDMYASTAAHPTMPLPSYARVTNLENGRSIIVRVNDRGPFLHNRVMDLSYAAAKELGYVTKGTAQVEIVRLTNKDIASGAWRSPASSTSGTATIIPSTSSSSASYPVTSPSQGWSVQVGVFTQRDNAEKYAAHAEAVLSSRGVETVVRIVEDAGRYRVVAGRGLDRTSASAQARRLADLLGVGAFAVEK